MTSAARPAQFPAGATTAGDGIVTGSGPVLVEAYIDFLCPFCRRFELDAGPRLADLLGAGTISLAYHPMSFLDDASTTRYSTRAAAASGCAADAGRFLEYSRALFENQPPEGSAGLSDAELTDLGATVGLGSGFGDCVRSGRYLDWAPWVTDLAEQRGVSATPTVLVNGAPVAPTSQAVAEAAGAA